MHNRLKFSCGLIVEVRNLLCFCRSKRLNRHNLIMRVELYFSLAIFLTLCLLGLCHPTLGDHNHGHVKSQKETVITARTTLSTKQREILDQDGKFVVEWDVDLANETVTFQVTAETTGFIGFGLSPGGGMEGSDIIIGGVGPTGEPYFADYHGVGPTAPVKDETQDWELLSAFENSTHTSLRFRRVFDSCDPHDVPITNDTVNFIWAMGPKDGMSYHFGVRGSLAANPIDPPYPAVDVSSFESWKLTVNQNMLNKSFSYWCTIHSHPDFKGKKNHVVGFRPVLVGPLAYKHTHHFVVYKCQSPPGLSAKRIFTPFSDKPGAECYTAESLRNRPFQLCSATLYVWGVGGKEFFLPEHTGYPVGEESDEYYMLEVHYDNPEKLTTVKFETGVEIFYTPKLRQYDAGMMTIGHTVLASLMIPPKSKDFMIVGHCGSSCTNKGVPKEGIFLFNTLLHTHLAGRKMKLRHYRNNTELPWISYDDHYHFNYQKNRPLREERKILPGDSLTFECTYDTLQRSDITVAGYSTRNEMCETFVWYYPKTNFEGCSSLYPIEHLYKLFGVKDVKWIPGIDSGAQPIIMAPSSMANKTFGDAVQASVTWTAELRQKLQHMVKDSDHEGVCNVKEDRPPPTPEEMWEQQRNPPTPPPKIMWSYPKLDKIYKPPIKCKYNIDDNIIPN